ncbi:UbiA prenyltransferase [Mycena sanguinolenta]|uniref:UbiA prenyltransferase n=1 Tax=Mycena sanguinolenta TaxID=230812 RepID=A0A8H6WXR9_9AGAR|nr:UbiA prenyltransferase [Mycena sanguinolenta]
MNRAMMEYRCRTLALVSDAVGYEIRLFWAFSWRDWSMTIIPGTIPTISALRSLDSASTRLVVESIAHSLAYFALFVYAFNLANQITGVDEDRINKPDRPLPSGLVTVRGAYIRWYAITLFHLAISATWGVLPWTIPWVLINIHVNFYGGDKHWFTKNLIFLSVGSFCQLQAAWGLVAPITLRETRWAGMLSCMLGIVMNLQDLRDVEGDRIAGRQTLPIVLGDSFRWVMAVIICAAPFVCWVSDFLVGYCGFGLAVSMFYVAYRVVSGGSREYDHRTYMIFTYIYCGCISVPGIFPMALEAEPQLSSLDFVKGLYASAGVEAMVDVWCEAPVRPIWKEFADAALRDEERAARWGGVEYWFVVGVHPHEARLYDDAVEADILEAMTHPRCVGWGEIGLDYHYDNLPPPRPTSRLCTPAKACEEVPKEHRIHIHCFTDSPAFAQRLLDWFPNLYIEITASKPARADLASTPVHCSTRCGAHTRLLLRVVRRAAALARRPFARALVPGAAHPALTLALRPTLRARPRRFSAPFLCSYSIVGMLTSAATGVITYTSNTDTSTAVRNMFTSCSNASATASEEDARLRILLETDAPYMVPAPIYTSQEFIDGEGKGKKLSLCHSGMVPWTAEFVASLLSPVEDGAAAVPGAATTQGEDGGVAKKEVEEGTNGEAGEASKWNASRVMRVTRANARVVYGV